MMKEEKKLFFAIIMNGLILFAVGLVMGLIMCGVFTFKWLFV
ncbi:hypothetical protein ABVC46_01605 [Lactobacillus crispatus]|jgi:hypothetical protein|uniref:Uncharacterized protein n=1 Tax=Lactobacillus crispatus TaxID=47770 RepID=A0AAW8WKF6_9LACO|nr:hypothetical protein [Lactobacillus crispatus]STX18427.1 Uncharacterised protein [Lactobacillus acidophilus]MCT7696908.1 hypothetical protein [Lactobacillus crispatus]MCT7708371.1 hypothetical protein [Lactobacillus crispatus]MCT7730784.1 hypothetical protein [Lactobacillus crispatus]MCT7802154.1 hypothetical protein [Lactobacillus crispatus]